MSVNQVSDTQIAQYASQAGFSQNHLVEAIAISLTESGGVANAQHLNTNGTIDYGLWQINSSHTQYNSNQLIFDPVYNAKAAYQLSSGGRNWGPWTTYSSGAYLKFMSRAQAAAAALQGPTTTPGSPSAFTVDQVFTSKGLWKWYSDRVTNRYDGVSEKGEDFGVAWGTPVGIVMGGIVVRSVHNNNSIGDVVEIQSGDGSVWLYQHIRARVSPQQKVSTGDIVGTEDGLPVDQYSTGPHIEVRYCPPGRWSASTDSWTEPWINPAGIFSRAGTFPATGPNVSLGGVVGSALQGGTTFGPPKTYIPLTEQIHETLINTPGFYGIALSLDEAEKFPGFIDLTQSEQVDIPIGAFGLEAGDITLPVPDVAGGARSIGATITDNFVPFAIRSGLVLVGTFIFIMLMAKAISGPVMEALPYLMEAAA